MMGMKKLGTQLEYLEDLEKSHPDHGRMWKATETVEGRKKRAGLPGEFDHTGKGF